jgi:hypothetical protein
MQHVFVVALGKLALFIVKWLFLYTMDILFTFCITLDAATILLSTFKNKL